jgi:predicted DCC family thiol-disulfide oxidoreductase YuxK
MVYDSISKNRYRWFGKTESCRMPTPELKAKFL